MEEEEVRLESINGNDLMQNKTADKILKVVRILAGVFVIVCGILIAFIISIFTLTGIASALHSSFFAYFMQFILIALLSGGCGILGLLIMRVKGKKKFIIPSIYTFCIWAIIFIFLLCITKLPVDAGTAYIATYDAKWSLSTGSEIAYTKYAPSTITQKYPIIILHGGPGAPVNGKDHFVDELASEGYEVYQYDQFGCGNSLRATNPSEYTLTRHIEDLEAIRKEIKAEKIILISHSFGGTLASNYMAKYNDMVNKSIFISPGDIWSNDESITKKTSAGNIDTNNALSKNFRYLMAQLLTNFGPSTGLYYLMDEEKLDNLFIKFHDDLNMRPGSDSYYNTKAAGFGFWCNVMTGKSTNEMECPYDNLKKSTAESLVIKSQYDYISFDVTKQFRDLITNSKMITIDNMGHSIEKEHESEIYENIKSFLNTGNPIKEPYTGDKSPWDSENKKIYFII